MKQNLLSSGSEIECDWRGWFSTLFSQAALNWYLSMVLFPGSSMVQQGVFFKKQFTSRLFIAVKMLLKYNHRVLLVKFMLDKNHKTLCLLNIKGLFFFCLVFVFVVDFFVVFVVGLVLGVSFLWWWCCCFVFVLTNRRKIENTWNLDSYSGHNTRSIRAMEPLPCLIELRGLTRGNQLAEVTNW